MEIKGFELFKAGFCVAAGVSMWKVAYAVLARYFLKATDKAAEKLNEKSKEKDDEKSKV